MSYLDTYTGPVPILPNAVAIDGKGDIVIAGVLIENLPDDHLDPDFAVAKLAAGAASRSPPCHSRRR